MATAVLGLTNDHDNLDTLQDSWCNDVADELEKLNADGGSFFPTGCLLSTDFNLTVVPGALEVDVSSGRGWVGAAGGRRLVKNAGTTRVTGLTASTTNYLFLARDGSFSANTTGVAPANTILVGTATTSGTEATSVNSNPTGRVNFATLAALGIAQTWEQKQTFAGEVEIDGALNHDGASVGFFGVAPAARAAAYTASNVTTDRSFDANATTLDEVADVLGTLIADLKTYGLLQ